MNMTAEAFNTQCPIGTPVRYYPILRDKDCIDTKTRSEAWELDSGQVVVKIEGRSGGIAIHHLDPITSCQPAPANAEWGNPRPCPQCSCNYCHEPGAICYRCGHYFPPQPAPESSPLSVLVDLFMTWKLPDDFLPDGGISFSPPALDHFPWPSGTNLFTAVQATEMFRQVAAPLLCTNLSLSERVAELEAESCNAEELRQIRADNVNLRDKLTKAELERDKYMASCGWLAGVVIRDQNGTPDPEGWIHRGVKFYQYAVDRFEAAEARLEEEERSCLAVIAERDEYHEAADQLSYAIAAHLGIEVGEHSSANSPWANAALALEDTEALNTAAAVHVLAERRRQIEQEGWTAEHDDHHSSGEMALAAAVYAAHYAAGTALDQGNYHAPFLARVQAFVRDCWPWHVDCWKPSNQRRNLIKAGALIQAEIERLDRALARGEK